MSSYGKPAVPKKELSLFDSTNLIVGIIIGVGIYQMAPDIARGAGSGWGVLLIWIIGGLLSLCGALGYAELASAYPRTGGDYIYLSRAYGSWAGFLFGWVQLLIVRPGDIAAMAFAFATYAHILYNPSADTELADGYKLYACAAIAAMTIINILGVREGKFTQNILTIIKVLALLAIVAVVLFSSRSSPVVQPVESFPTRVA
ncbi:MAG: amino acid permease, partial [Sedimentisphaerales bacterium]|nr:amino acid permease [Sedimentisphaerales bacterium]